MPTRSLSSRALRSEISLRALSLPSAGDAEQSMGRLPCVVHRPSETGEGHGNFLPASFRRICARPEWAARLQKAYTSEARLPWRHDRRRGELECATSSDALLMNVFCYPGVLRRRAVCDLFGVPGGVEPAFGVRVDLPMRGGETDRTELDLRIGEVLVEAKLTETGFGYASRERLLRYQGVEKAFDLERLPYTRAGFAAYQIVRGLLAATQSDTRYVVLLDDRRSDLKEICFQAARAARRASCAATLRLVTWQELSTCLPPVLRGFLLERYGITAERAT